MKPLVTDEWFQKCVVASNAAPPWGFHFLEEDGPAVETAPTTPAPDPVFKLRARTTVGAYAIGSLTWPGIGKAVEEMGELLQVLGKIIGAGGKVDHWDGKAPLNIRLEEEMADVRASLQFLMYANKLDRDHIYSRIDKKLKRFNGWHDSPEPTP